MVWESQTNVMITELTGTDEISKEEIIEREENGQVRALENTYKGSLGNGH